MKRPLVILTGPTAVGKTGLSIKLAKQINGEIISADSMQVYKGMDIGTAKITKDEMDGVPHHLIDILEPTEEFSVVEFQKRATEAVEEIYSHGAVPIVVGGTGFYIQALLYGIDFTENNDNSAIRERLSKEMLVNPERLYEKLCEVDPEATEYIHKNNHVKIIRALEFYELTGEKISAHNREQHEKEPAFNSAYFVLTDSREHLYERIDKRVDKMLANGLVNEVQSLLASGCTGNMISMLGLGYKEIISYLEGECDLEKAVYDIKNGTRHFSKRQMTWFKREKNVIFLDRDKFSGDEEILEEINRIIRDKGIIQ